MKGMERTTEDRQARRLFLLLAAGEILLLVMILLFANIKYEVSDDFIMEMVASGAYTGQPDSHIMFSNILLGWLLTLFYRVVPSVSWYFWGQMILCLCSYLAITYALTHSLRPAGAVFAVLVFTAFTARDLYILPQFTKTAVAASMGGLILLIWALFHQKGWKYCLIGGVLAFIGALVRQKGFYISVAFAGVQVLYESISALYHKRWKIKGIFSRAWIPGLLLLVAVFGCGMIDGYAYTTDSNYSYYRAFSKTRSQILDYTWLDYEDCRSDFEAIGLSENDYNMILGWDFADPEVFSLEKMDQVLDIIESHRVDQHPTLLEALYMIKARQLYYPITSCCILLGLFCVVVNWKRLWVPAVAAVMALSFLIYFYWIGRWVYRVEFGILYCAAVLIACFCQPVMGKRALELAACTAAVVIAGMQVSGYLPDQTWRALDTEAYRTLVDNTYYYSWNYNPAKYTTVVSPGKLRPDFLQTLREHPDDFYVLDFNTAIQTLYYDFSVFESSRSCFPRNAVFLAGVTEYHPSVQNYLSALGYDDLMEALLEDDVYFVSNGSEDLIMQFYQEHYEKNVQLISCGEIDGYQIWKYSLQND